jgi:hypothetical protein
MLSEATQKKMFTVSWFLQSFVWITNPANVGENSANFCDNRMEFGQFRGRKYMSRVTSKRKLSTEEAIVVISNSGTQDKKRRKYTFPEMCSPLD